eukprot:m.58832 g.58832  ORF g.58832 m.58832 type:complete len:336 (-) comp19049_c0_seq2:120-1127(-)
MTSPPRSPAPKLSWNDSRVFREQCAEKNNADAMRAFLARHDDRTPNSCLFWGDDIPLLVDASYHGAPAVVKVLLQSGANVNATDKTGNTALSQASQTNHLEVVKILVGAGADLNMQNRYGASALVKASCSGHLEVAKVLVAAGADLNLYNGNGITALMLTCAHGSFELAKILVAAGADLNLRNNAGDTALMFSSRFGHFEVVKILVAAGADLSFQNNNGKTALKEAQDRNLSQIVAQLKRPPPRWTLAAHLSLLTQPKYRRNMKLLVWCMQRTDLRLSLPYEMLWHVLSYLTLSELNHFQEILRRKALNIFVCLPPHWTLVTHPELLPQPSTAST